MTGKIVMFTASLALAATVVGCRIHDEKGANGEDKSVQIDTPFGGVHVNTDKTTAADLGLPVYPGAEVVKEGDHKSADVHLGFGQWELRVRVVTYATLDSRDKVIAFYRREMAHYGDVLVCQGDVAVGTPTVTAEGLTCQNDQHAEPKININGRGNAILAHEFKLKAGSKRHQHITSFEEPRDGKTRFVLVALDLPTGDGSQSGKSD